MPKLEIIRAMFDVRPVDQSGHVDLEKINLVEPTINLRKSKLLKIAHQESSGRKRDTKLSGVRLSEPGGGNVREALAKELQQELKKKTNLSMVVAKMGGSISSPQLPAFLWRRRMVIRQQKAEAKTKIILPKSEAIPISPALKDKILDRAYGRLSYPKAVSISLNTSLPPSPASMAVKVGTEKLRKKYFSRSLIVGIALVAVAGLLLAGFLKKDSFQQKVVKDGNAAVQNLVKAKADIEKFDFASAAKSFNLAQDNFSAASDRLNLLGNAFGSFLGGIPGLGKLKSAQNLTAAGENIAKAGENLSLAADNLSKTNFVAYFRLAGKPEQSLSNFINSFRDSLIFADKRIGVAKNLLAEIDPEVIPQDKRTSFLGFKKQLPMLEMFLKGALGYSDLLLELVGQSGPKKYLVLFQNNTELRPSGGFIGSYALADFNRGFLRGLEVKDVYETDGQAKHNIVPPKELQHITPVWGMRDANWFANFPDSAKKIMQIYTGNDGGPAVDGVITITPTIISKILEITGPVDLPSYQKNISSENFLAAIQQEVEYGPNRTKPKQILIDFVPKFLEKLGQLDKEKWAGIFKTLSEGAEQKHILAYFKNQSMEKMAVSGGFGGEIKFTEKDYLSIVHTNVKGSKTDAFIDNDYELQSAINSQGKVGHVLAITRKHHGGKTGFGFYNRTNYDYLRVLVPNGSELLEINGQSAANFSPIVDYGDGAGFVKDQDLAAYEQKAVAVKPGVKQFNEGEKTVFGFWMFLDPGKTKTITLKYETPVSLEDNQYSLLVQKQPGTISNNFRFSMAMPADKQVIYKNPDLTSSGHFLNFETPLLKDTTLELKFQ